MTTESRDNSDLPEHKVAMVVFTTVRAVDELDAAGITKVAIKQALLKSASSDHERLTVNSHDVDDCRGLLLMLGLIEERP